MKTTSLNGRASLACLAIATTAFSSLSIQARNFEWKDDNQSKDTQSIPVQSIFDKFVTLGKDTFYLEGHYSLPVRGVRSAASSPDGSNFLLVSGTSTLKNLSGGEYSIGQISVQFVNPGLGKKEPSLSPGRLNIEFVASGLESPDPSDFIVTKPEFLSSTAVVFEHNVLPSIGNSSNTSRTVPFARNFTKRALTLLDSQKGIIATLPLEADDKMFAVPDNNRPGYKRAFVYLNRPTNSKLPFFQEITPQGYGNVYTLPEGTVAISVDKFGNIRCTVPVDSSPESELVPRIFSPFKGEFVNDPESNRVAPLPEPTFFLERNQQNRFTITDREQAATDFPRHSIPIGEAHVGLLSPSINPANAGINILLIDGYGSAKVVKLTPTSLKVAQESIVDSINERKAKALSNAIEALEDQATAFSNMTDTELKAALQSQIDLRDLPSQYQNPFDWGSSQMIKFHRNRDENSQALVITVTSPDGRVVRIASGGVSFKDHSG